MIRATLEEMYVFGVSTDTRLILSRISSSTTLFSLLLAFPYTFLVSSFLYYDIFDLYDCWLCLIPLLLTAYDLLLSKKNHYKIVYSYTRPHRYCGGSLDSNYSKCSGNNLACCCRYCRCRTGRKGSGPRMRQSKSFPHASHALSTAYPLKPHYNPSFYINLLILYYCL